VIEQNSDNQFTRAGVWRRLLALLIDAIAITVLTQLLAMLLYPLSHGRVQFAGGFYALSCSKLDKAPDGADIPADFNANSITDCRQTVFGLTSARILHVARITREGAVTRTVQIARMLDTDGGPIAAFSLDLLALPLLIAWRLGFDRGRGTPGRRMCRIRLANAGDGGPPGASAVWRRYGLLFVVFSPFLIWSIGEMLWPTSAADPGWLLFIVIVSYCPSLIVLLQAWRAAFRRQDPWYDRFAGTCVLRVDPALTVAPISSASAASVFD